MPCPESVDPFRQLNDYASPEPARNAPKGERAGFGSMDSEGHHKIVHLPIAFSGPVCAECKYRERPPKRSASVMRTIPPGELYQQCTAHKREVITAPWRSAISGLVTPAVFSDLPLCVSKNGDGKCPDFAARVENK